ncbi:MAG: hypothetical protein K2G78_03845, partial [Muribaculaceae bacterium]|nr:hypothetical protein [Muribaculaceae bacterium]
VAACRDRLPITHLIRLRVLRPGRGRPRPYVRDRRNSFIRFGCRMPGAGRGRMFGQLHVAAVCGGRYVRFIGFRFEGWGFFVTFVGECIFNGFDYGESFVFDYYYYF